MGKEIGIDFGTTNTIISYYDGDFITQYRYQGTTQIPSVIYFKTKDQYEIGVIAKNKRTHSKSNAGIDNIKMLLLDPSKKCKIVAENGDIIEKKPKFFVTQFLRRLLNDMRDDFRIEYGVDEGSIDKVVVTVPVAFDDAAISKIKKAVIEAIAIKQVECVSEPTAAAFAACTEEKMLSNDTVAMVYDFGGGTFDVSVIKRTGKKFEQVTRNGISDLGGRNITNLLKEIIVKKIASRHRWETFIYEANDNFVPEFDEYEMSEDEFHDNMFTIENIANEIKEELSTELKIIKNFILYANGDSYEEEIEFSRKGLEELIRPMIEKTINMTLGERALAKEKGYDKLFVVFAGGTSNIPLISDMLADEIASDDEFLYVEDVSSLISRGAVMLARKMSLLRKITSSKTVYRLGVSVHEGANYNVFKTIIPENVDLPYTNKYRLNLDKDDQRRLRIGYYIHDIKNYPNTIKTVGKNNGIKLVDTLIIDNLPKGLKRNDCWVEVEFKAEQDGTVTIYSQLLDLSGKLICRESLITRNGSDED